MTALELILKKRQGNSLTTEEINWLVDNYTNNNMPDYQMSAFLMAAFFQGLNHRETKALTLALAESGEILDFSPQEKIVDKHSSGGVGDKTTLILGPLVAAAGVYFAKYSGRGLGFTGGTIDKLESIPGFRTNFSSSEFKQLVLKHGLAVVAQSSKITPADGKIYSLRDVTGTVDNNSFIASSIMAKKIAGGAKSILLDVKTGQGAFMKDQEQAFQLAETMVRLGKDLKKDVVAVVTDMSQPLGFAIGNNLEVKEAISTLQRNGPDDLTSLCISLGGLILAMAGEARSAEEGKEIINNVLNSGEGMNKFEEMVKAQGGDVSYIHSVHNFPEAPYKKTLYSDQKGYVSSMNAEKIGKISRDLGAGRKDKNSKIDHTVGIILNKKIGYKVKENDKIATVYGSCEDLTNKACRELLRAIIISEDMVEAPSLIHGVLPPVSL